MNHKNISALLTFGFAMLLAACATDPAKTEPTPAPPPVDAAPAPGSQAEADAVADTAAGEGVETTAMEGEPAADDTADPPAVEDANRKPETHSVVTAVLPPAWIFRGDLSTALLPGTAVYEGDRIETGPDGRAQLVLDDGAKLQIGGGARLIMTRLLPNETASLNGTLDLSRGTFAFESGKNGTLLPGDLDFKLGKLTAFATQAALMGKSDVRESVLCLLTGTTEVSLQGQDPVTLDTPKSCVTTSKTGTGTAGQLKTLQANLQPPAGLKAMKHKGTWALVLISEGSENAAKKAAQKLWKEGYPAEVIEASSKGKTYFRVALRGFESREAAATLKKRAATLGYPKAWVHGK